MLLLFSSLLLVGQELQYAKLDVTINGEEPKLGVPFFSDILEDSIILTKVKFYISSLLEEQQPTLVDLNTQSSFLLPYIDSTEKLKLQIGIDSLTNLSGAQGGSLDPLYGMYWTWNSGYINVKIEGYSPALTTRKGEFKLHLGGFLHPHQSAQEISFSISDKMIEYQLELDLADFLRQIDLAQTPTIMSPSQQSVELSRLFASSFKLKSAN